MDTLNVVVDECFKFSITMLLNSTIMLVIVLHYASICSYVSILLLCSKLCQHNSPRPTTYVYYTSKMMHHCGASLSEQCIVDLMVCHGTQTMHC